MTWRQPWAVRPQRADGTCHRPLDGVRSASSHQARTCPQHIGSDRKANASESHSDNRASLLTQALEQALAPGVVPTGSAPDDQTNRVPVARLLRGQTGLAVIIALKDHAKAKVAEADNKAHGDVATALYYGCIASALVHHGQQISSFSYQDLVSALLALRQKKWMNPQLSTLLEEAQAICEQRQNSQ